MPIVEGGPPQWIWERPAEQLKWEVVPATRPQGTEYELRVSCGLEILRLQFLTSGEVRELQAALAELPSADEGGSRVDRTGIIPEGVRIDPDLTEGHPGYEESGPSEIRPR